jgi:hypothetical protein
MGFHPAWKFERVTELTFAAGRLVKSEDQSARYAAQRAQLSHEPLKPEAGSAFGRIQRWIRSTFDQSYGNSRKRDN